MIAHQSQGQISMPDDIAAESDGDEISATIHPTRVPPEVDGGQPNPSSNAAGAKSDGAHTIVGRAGAKPGITDRQLEQENASASQDRNEPVSDSGATADRFEPPAFLRREQTPLRPHSRNPGDECGGYGRTHCRACLIAAGELEAA